MNSEAELDRLLAQEPGNIEALVRKGDLRSAAGDERSASAFYKAALRAAAAAQPLPVSLKPAIERAQAGIALAEQSFHEHQEQLLASAGFPEGQRPPRFQQALDRVEQKFGAGSIRRGQAMLGEGIRDTGTDLGKRR